MKNIQPVKKAVLMLAALALSATFSVAFAQHSDKETQENICAAELQAACKGLAIGKYCGMKHAH